MTHGCAIGGAAGKCAKCGESRTRSYKAHAAKAEKMALYEEESSEEDDAPACKRLKTEIKLLEDDIDLLHGKYQLARDEARAEYAKRVDAEIARNKLSVELSRVKWSLEAANKTIAALQDRVKMLQPMVDAAHPAASVPEALLAAGGAGAGAVTGPGGRNIQACLRCRGKQQKCNGDGVSPCARCIKMGETCEYGVPGKRGPKPKSS